jgi:two-component system OmpR family sensor kinase
MRHEPVFGGAGLRRRIVASTVLISTIGMTVLVGLVLFLTDRSTDREMSAALSARAAAVLATTAYADGRLQIADANDALYDSLTWVYDGSGRQLEGPTVPAGLRSAVSTLSSVPGLRTDEAGRWRLLAQPITSHGRRVGNLVVALNGDPYRSVQGRTAAASAALGLIVIVGMSVLSWLIVGRALRPVARMAASADAWSQERLDQRFGLGQPRDEITALGAVLDSLLERVSQVIRAEQRLTAELAHELRTPLTVIKGEADLGRMSRGLSDRERERFERIAEAATDMGAAMTTLLDVARGGTGLDASTPVVPVIRTLLDRAARPGRTLALSGTDASAAVPHDLLERILAPILENADRYAVRAIRVRVAEEGGRVAITIGNDGEPVRDATEDDLFTPGFRGPDSPGAGLGLALARRLARAAGGDVVLRSSAPVEFAVTLPRPRSAPTRAVGTAAGTAPRASETPSLPDSGDARDARLSPSTSDARD